MGGVNSRNSSKAVSAKTERKITSLGLKDKNFSLEDFVAEMVNQLAEQKVEEIVEEERRKISKKDEGELQVLDYADEFFRSTLAKDDRNDDDEASGKSQTPSPPSTTSSSPIENSSESPTLAHSVGVPADQIMGLIVNIPSRMIPFFHEALEFFWNLRTSCKPGTFEEELKMLEAPPRFSNECVEDEDVELCRTADQLGFMSRSLFFDFVREILQRIYEGEDEDIQNNRQPAITSSRYRLWLGTKRPNSFSLLERIVKTNLETDFGVKLTVPQDSESLDVQLAAPSPAPIVKDIGRLPQLTQWTIKDKNWLNQLLEVEMRADDQNWMNYWPFEKALMESLISKILSETFDEVYDRCEKGLGRDFYEEDIQLENHIKETRMNDEIDDDNRVGKPNLIS
ncbi:hypothetical protein Aperf_G00000090540 [Anoplocephala perfoliata]